MTQDLDYKYIAYIDEAGDPGIRKVRPIDEGGASEWLSLGAVVIRVEREMEIVELVKSIRERIKSNQRPDLHFRHMTDSRKKTSCEMVAKSPLRGFILLSNKKNMRGYQNPRPKSHHPNQWFYNFCCRLLLERVTHFVEAHSIRTYGSPKRVRIIFSNRGGVEYGHQTAYFDQLKQQSRANTTYLNKHTIKWRVFDRRLMETRPHHTNAGLQIADLIASAFYQSADYLGPTQWTTRYAKTLSPIMAKRSGTHRNYGVCLQPTPPEKACLTPEQKEIFEYYGYKF